MVDGHAHFSVSGFSGELSGAWVLSDLVCMDRTAAAPSHTNADYEATVTAVNVQEGWVEYSVYITPPDVTDGVTKNEHGLIGYQHVGGTMRVARSFAGGIELAKASADGDVSSENACYSLAGAVYGVYGDEACTDCRFSMTTDRDGRWRTAKDVPVGTYWVKEIAPPAGYALDRTAYRTVVQAGGYVAVNGGAVLDVPQTDPADILVRKHDSQLGPSADGGIPQGAASLAHAQFTLKFYGGLHSTTDLGWIEGATPLRTWTMQTDARGVVSLSGADGTFVDGKGETHPYKLSGSDFYRSSDGRIALPLGTLTVQETAAPEGYLLPDDPRVHVRRITGEGALDAVDAYLAPAVPEQAARGDVALTKVSAKTPAEGASGVKDVLVGVDFQIVNDNEGAVVRADGTLAAKGDVVATITTDDRGYAATENGALPYGTYLVREVASTVPEGYALVEEFAIAIAEEGQELYYVLEDGTGTPIRVVKTDAETGRQIAGRTTFRILDANMQPVTFTRYYPATSHMTAFTTDAAGACMLPERLNGGATYYLQEIAAPEGYVLNGEPIPFVVDGTAGHTWANPLTVELPDNPQKGTIRIAKTDADTGAAVGSCTFEVRAAGDIVTSDGTVRALAGDAVATLTTGEDGTATTGELYLGSYDVVETSQADGYVLDGTRHAATLAYAGQTVAVTSAQVDAANHPTRIEVRKTRVGSGEPVAGATFSWWREGDEEHAGQGVTDAEGLLPVAHLAPGAYWFAETEAPAGNLPDPHPQRIVVGADGRIDGKDVGALSFANDCTKTLFSKTDLATGAEIPGAALELYAIARDEDGTERRSLVEMWTSNGEPHLIEALPPGDYVLHEEIAPDGYLAAEDVRFTVELSGEVQEVEMKDDRTKVDILKVDADAEEALPGAVLALVDAEGAYVDPRGHMMRPAGIEVREIEAKDRASGESADDGANAAYGWVSATEPVRFEGLAVGEYSLVEIEPPEGYLKAEPVRFDVAAVPEAQRTTMADEAEGSAFAQTGADAPSGAGMAILAAVVTGCAGIAAWRRFRTAG